MSELKTHPIQKVARHEAARLPETVTLKAYEVYVQLYGPQKAMITAGCRGGFSTGEIIAFLYASSFPKTEWNKRVDEATRGMEGL